MNIDPFRQNVTQVFLNNCIERPRPGRIQDEVQEDKCCPGPLSGGGDVPGDISSP